MKETIMTAGEFVEQNPELRKATVEFLFEQEKYEELEYRMGEDDMWRDPDGNFCEQEDVEEDMLERIELYSSDIKTIKIECGVWNE